MSPGRWLMTACLAAGLLNLGAGLYIPAKAAAAQFLMQRAWQRGESTPTLDEVELRPWPWADTFPLARLTGDRLDSELFVLSGASGRTLAFGPGHLQASARPGDPGNSIIAGHRDTHFAFLEHVRHGDRLVIDRRDGARIVFEVEFIEVMHAARASVALASATPMLTLITCYPFDVVQPGGPLRLVVSARRVD